MPELRKLVKEGLGKAGEGDDPNCIEMIATREVVEFLCNMKAKRANTDRAITDMATRACSGSRSRSDTSS